MEKKHASGGLNESAIPPGLPVQTAATKKADKKPPHARSRNMPRAGKIQKFLMRAGKKKGLPAL